MQLNQRRKGFGTTSKDKRSETLGLHENTFSSRTDDISAYRAPNHDEVRRGGIPGQELEDWLQAEREIESTGHFMRATIGEKHRP